MRSLKYQLKNIRKDKMCVLTFLLPIVVGIAINFLSGMSFQNIGEISFAGLKNDLSEETILWLKQNGTYAEYDTITELENAVNEPSSQIIGVLKNGNSIRTFLSGDELEVNRIAGNTLPQLYQNRDTTTDFRITKIPLETNNDGVKAILIAITLVTAMFMGCTFNAMNIIGEKEDGISFINQILPMTVKTYVIQKTALGFIGSFISTVFTALICMKLNVAQIIPFIIIMILSTYISSLVGLYIGRHSEGLMVGIVYIKIIMILFLAPPILIYLTVSSESPLFFISYLLPSSATFYGLMDMLIGQSKNLWIVITVLLSHTVLWSVIYYLMEANQVRNPQNNALQGQQKK